ncbi:MAG: hypothetical protein Q4C81_00965 [Kocuria sp.]|nr:hypothetical protein [Kocuria sp.]
MSHQHQADHNHYSFYTPPPAPVAGTPRLWVGIVVLCLAPVAAVVGVVLGILQEQHRVRDDLASAEPGLTHELHAGQHHTLYAPQSDGATFDTCSIHGPDDAPVPIAPSSGNAQTTPDGREYTDIADFTTTQSGPHHLFCDNSFDTVAVETPDSTTTLMLLPYGAVGLLIAGAGATLIVLNRLSISRRRRMAENSR